MIFLFFYPFSSPEPSVKPCETFEGIAETLAKCGTPVAPNDHRCVAIVDPPRSGLHPKVIRALRECKAIDRLVYVSCNPTGSFVEDAIKLVFLRPVAANALSAAVFTLVQRPMICFRTPNIVS